MFVIFWASPGESKFLGGLGSEGPLSLSETLFLFQNVLGVFLICLLLVGCPLWLFALDIVGKEKENISTRTQSRVWWSFFGRPIFRKYVWKVVAEINAKYILKRHAIIVIPRPSGPEKVP
jgi:hypothetical protein